ncbi:transposase, partial [Mycolicibacterium insubricum]|uniref:transposase n=1 Tax=Mycolicibacterium insubricum TaxID=444597 RepID=UPI0021F29DC2
MIGDLDTLMVSLAEQSANLQTMLHQSQSVLSELAARRHGPYRSGHQDPDQTPVESGGRKTGGRIRRTHARAAAVRRDVLHKATTRLAQQHQIVVVETLNAAGMRATGGARKRGLNRAL